MLSDCWNACAVPWKPVAIVAGTLSSRFARSIASVACPSAVFGARLKEIVTAGNCPWWLMESGATGTVVQVAKAASGTCPPVVGDFT